MNFSMRLSYSMLMYVRQNKRLQIGIVTNDYPNYVFNLDNVKHILLPFTTQSTVIEHISLV